MKEPLDHLRSRKKPVRKSTRLAGNNEISEELAQVEEELSRLQSLQNMKKANNGEVGELALQKIEDLTLRAAELKHQQDEDSVKFTFQALRRRDADKLREVHPPTDEEVAEAKAGGEDNVPFSPGTYPIALILATMVEPEYDHFNEEEYNGMKEWLESEAFNDAEFMHLFQTAISAQMTRTTVTLGKD